MAWHATHLTSTALPHATLVATRAGERAIVVTRIGAAVYAIEDRCSHAGCPFSEDGELDGTTVICDCHGSEFDIRTGAVVRSPATAAIAAFPTRIADGRVEVDL